MTHATILTIEDDPAIRRGIVDALTYNQYTVIEAGDGDEGLKRSTQACLLYTSPSPRDATLSRMPSSA